MNTLLITRVSNGYILTLVDENSNELESAIATKDNPRGYSRDNLVSAIEDIFDRNTPSVAIADSGLTLE